MPSIATTWLERPQWAAAGTAHCLQALLAATSWLYLATLAVMLFRPPDVQFHHLDRIAFLVLIFVVFLRVLASGERLNLAGPVNLPLLGLLLLASWDLVTQPYASELWAGFVTRWVIPLVFFHLAQFVFQDREERKKLETFCLITLAYLAIIAIFFLVGMLPLVLPAFILDENLGIHADRARGPFLQAVANGVSLNLLGLVALNAFRKGRLRGGIGFVLLASLPLAILATKTRAVWLSFALSILVLGLISQPGRLRRACLAMMAVSGLAVILALGLSDSRDIAERFADESPIDFRSATYQAAWQMFLEKPALGWDLNDIQPEMLKRAADLHSSGFVIHNSFLDLAVARGSLGLLFYLWLYIDLFRLPRGPAKSGDTGFRGLWPVMVGVYALNACFVLMQYQFVNAILFTFAGILAGENRRSR